MQEKNTQFYALVKALEQAGFAPDPDAGQSRIVLTKLPEFKDSPVFALSVVMERPFVTQWDCLFDDCILESGAMAKGAAHGKSIYSRKKAVERAKQEKWVALWALYDRGILSERHRPAWGRWEEVSLP